MMKTNSQQKLILLAKGIAIMFLFSPLIYLFIDSNMMLDKGGIIHKPTPEDMLDENIKVTDTSGYNAPCSNPSLTPTGDSSYIRDREHICYWESGIMKVLEEADAATFKSIEWNSAVPPAAGVSSAALFALDKYGIYANGIRVSEFNGSDNTILKVYSPSISADLDSYYLLSDGNVFYNESEWFDNKYIFVSEVNDLTRVYAIPSGPTVNEHINERTRGYSNLAKLNLAVINGQVYNKGTLLRGLDFKEMKISEKGNVIYDNDTAWGMTNECMHESEPFDSTLIQIDIKNIEAHGGFGGRICE